MLQRVTKLLGLVLLGVALTLVGCSRGLPAGQIELSTTEFDLGTIPNTKAVTHVFEIRNRGGGDLTISGVSTSCGCTTAEVDKLQLAPGETARLTVTFDPQAHGGATGRFMRQVYVRSDDPDMPEARLTLNVAVVEG